MKKHTLKFSRRNLPHWIVADASYFVTIRLDSTLPKEVVRQLTCEREELEARCGDETEKREMDRRHFLTIESILDSVDASKRFLDEPVIAECIMKSLDWLRERGWKIYAAVLLSTHMHLLMRNVEGKTDALLSDMAQFKNYTGRECNKLLNRNGRFWAREQFDHWIRNGDKFESTVRYIAMNPVKAGRVANWKKWAWIMVDESALYCLDFGATS